MKTTTNFQHKPKKNDFQTAKNKKTTKLVPIKKKSKNKQSFLKDVNDDDDVEYDFNKKESIFDYYDDDVDEL